MSSEAESEGVAVVAEAIGEARCANATPDQTFAGPTFTSDSPSSYWNGGCTKAWVVQVNSSTADVRVKWNDALPTAQAACNAAWVRLDAYKLTNNTWTQVGSASDTGNWSGGACAPPQADLNLPGNGSYKFTATARTSDSSSAGVRKVRVHRILLIDQ